MSEPLHLRQTIDRLKRKVDISQEREMQLLDTMRILGVEDYSPEMTDELLRFVVINEPTERAIAKVLAIAGKLSESVHVFNQNQEEVIISVNGVTSAIQDLPDKIRTASYNGTIDALSSVSAENAENLKRVMDSTYVSKDDMIATLKVELAEIKHAFVSTVKIETEELKGLRKVLVKTAISPTVLAIVGAVALFIGVCLGKFTF